MKFLIEYQCYESLYFFILCQNALAGLFLSLKCRFLCFYRNLNCQQLLVPQVNNILGDMNRSIQRWLDAYSDPHSLLYSFTRCIALADLEGDGNFKLVLADLGTGTSNAKLKIFKGTSLLNELTLFEFPTALVTFYNEQQEQKIPAVAVASGSYIYIYKNMKPYYKFSLPDLDINPLELDLWIQARNNDIEPDVLYNMLENIKNEIGFSNLSNQSQKLLITPSHKKENIKSDIMAYSSEPIKRQTVITCMTTLFKSNSLSNSVSCLIVGTENGGIHIIDSEAFTILDSVNQSSETHTTDETVPVVIKAIGLYDVDYRIVIYNRNGKVTLLKRGWVQVKMILQLSIQAVDMCLLPDSGNIFLGLMDSSIECYTKKGKKLWNIKLASNVTGLLFVPLPHQGINLIAVALEGGTICFYNGRDLVDSVMAADTVVGMVFGRFGQEEHCLILITISGILQVKVLKRTAQFSNNSSAISSVNHQNLKLKIPKKTKIFLEQAAYEMNNSIQIHQTFQNELFRFRLEVSRNFYESLNKMNNSISNDSKLPLKLSAEVFGLGPTFKISLTLENMSQTSENSDILSNKVLGIVFHYNEKIYYIKNSYLHVPFLIPGLVYTFETLVQTLKPLGTLEEINVFIVNPNEKKPILSTVIHMPVCDVLPIEI